jgi:hypothetical protein
MESQNAKFRDFYQFFGLGAMYTGNGRRQVIFSKTEIRQVFEFSSDSETACFKLQPFSFNALMAASDPIF